MNRIVSVVLLIGGLVFMIIGINGTNPLHSDDAWIFTGKPSNKARLMLFGGAGAAIVGLRMTLRKRKRE